MPALEESMESSVAARLTRLEEQMQRQQSGTKDQLSLFVFSGDWDKLFSAFVLATGAAASGTRVVMFFTFWASAALRRGEKVRAPKSWLERMFGGMLPRGSRRTALSRMNFGGMGLRMMQMMMRQKKIASLEELISTAGDLGVEINICEMSMDIIGFRREEMFDYPGLSFCGVQTFLETAAEGKVTLYI